MYLIDIMAKTFRLTMYFVCRFCYNVLRSHMPFVCSEYVAQYLFVWTISCLCRYTISYVIGMFETQVVTLVVVVPVRLISFAWFSEEWIRVLPSFVVLHYCSVFLKTIYLLSYSVSYEMGFMI